MTIIALQFGTLTVANAQTTRADAEANLLSKIEKAVDILKSVQTNRGHREQWASPQSGIGKEAQGFEKKPVRPEEGGEGGNENLRSFLTIRRATIY